MNEVRTLLEEFWICKATDKETYYRVKKRDPGISEIYPGAAWVEAGSYGESSEAGKASGTCRAVYGNRDIYRYPGLLYSVRGSDVPGR